MWGVQEGRLHRQGGEVNIKELAFRKEGTPFVEVTCGAAEGLDRNKGEAWKVDWGSAF